MYPPFRITLFVAIPVLLSAACTQQLVRDGETSTTVNEISGSKEGVAMEQAAAPTEPAFQNTGSYALDTSQGEDTKVQIAEPVDKPKPLMTSTKPKVKAKPNLKIVPKPEVKTKRPSLVVATKKPVTSLASQSEPDEENMLPITSEPTLNRDASTESRGKVKETVAAKSAEKLETGPDTADSEPEVAVVLESADDHQQLAMLSRQNNLSEAATPETPPLDMADLPLSFGVHWSLDRRPNPIDHKTQCLLASRSVNISDGYERTDVQLLLTANSLYVRTESNLDLSYPDTGISLDNGTLVPFEGLAKETAAMISGDIEMLYEQMAPSRTVLVKLGFWPTWPVTKTQEASFPLEGFDQAIKALWLCEKM